MLHPLLRALAMLVAILPLLQASPQDDELTDFRQNLEERLRRHPYFSRITYDWVWDHEPFVFVVQRPTPDQAGYAERVAAERLVWLKPLHERFLADYGRPLGLKLRDTSPRLVVFVLASPGDFVNYQRVLWKDARLGYGSFYNPDDRMLLVQEDPFGKSGAAQPTNRHFQRRDAACLILHGYGASLMLPPGPLWFREGMADDLGSHRRDDPAALSEREPSAVALEQLASTLRNANERAAYLLPLADVFTMTSFAKVVEACAERAKRRPGFEFNPRDAVNSYNAQASILYHYLHRDAKPELVEAMRAFIENTMKGRRKGQRFEAELSADQLWELERDLYQYAWKEYRRAFPDENHDTAPLTAFLQARAPATSQVELAGFGAENALDSLDAPELLLALAIARARAGDAEEAVALLQRICQEHLQQEPARRALRELDRVEAWVLLRDAWLAELVETGTKLNVTYREKRLVAKVEKVEGGVLHLAANRLDVENLPVSELDPVELSNRMTDAGFEERWERAYPLVIAFDAKAKRLLKGEEPEAVLLREDAEGDYPGRREGIEALELLLELTRLEEPVTLEEARRAIDGVQTLWAKRYQQTFVSKLRGDLRVTAKRALDRQFELQGMGAVLHGEVEPLTGGRVRVRYDFEKADQILDWPLQEGDEWVRSDSDELKRETSFIEVRDGKLHAAGKIARRHLLAFEGPQVVRWKEIASSGAGVRPDLELHYRVSLCCAADGSFASLVNSVSLEVFEFESGELRRENSPTEGTRFDTLYNQELHHDGVERITLWRNGKEIIHIPCGPRLSGHVEVWTHSDYVLIYDDLEITGRVTEESLTALRRRWVEGRLAEMQF